MNVKKIILIISLVLVLLIPAACGAEEEEAVHSEEIRIATKNTDEQIILAHLASILLTEKTEHEVTIAEEENFTSKSLYENLRDGKIDLYFDYAGSIYLNALEEPISQMEYAVILVQIQTAMLEEGIYVSDSLGYDGGHTLYMTPELRDQLGLDRGSGISSLTELSSDLTIGMESSFYENEDGYKALCKAYDLEFKDAKVYTEDEGFFALRRGDIDIMVGSRTSVYNNLYNLFLFADDGRFFTPETACFVADDELLIANPEIKDVLSSMEDLLTSGTVSSIIRKIDLESQDLDEYLRDFLRARNML